MSELTLYSARSNTILLKTQEGRRIQDVLKQVYSGGEGEQLQIRKHFFT